MIRVTNFDVGKADCFLIHFEKDNKYFNLLIDGAYAKNRIDEKLEEKVGDEKIQGIVVTHIDSDHIMGILSLVKRKIALIEKAFFLFNKYDEDLISYTQARNLANEIEKNFSKNYLVKSYLKNYTEELNREINALYASDNILEVNLMSIGQRKKCDKLNDDIVNISILAPSQENIQKFMRNWNDEKVNASIINASSIMLLIEFEGKALLMSGDGYLTDIEEKLQELEISKIDVIKAAHHGAGENNVRLKEIAQKYQCEEILFTISGAKDDKHPSLELIKGLKEQNEKTVLSCSAELKDEDLKNYMIQKNDIEISMKGQLSDE